MGRPPPWLAACPHPTRSARNKRRQVISGLRPDRLLPHRFCRPPDATSSWALRTVLVARQSLLLHREATLFDLAQQLRLIRPLDPALFIFAEGFGMQIVATLFFGLIFFDWNAVLVRPCILTNARHLPRDFHSRRAGLNREPILFHFLSDNCLSELAYDCELIT